MAPSSKSTTSTRGTPTPSLTKSNSSSKNQTTIAGFFKKKSEEPNISASPKVYGTSFPIKSLPRRTTVTVSSGGSAQSMTPAPSSDPAEEIKEEEGTSPINAKGTSGSNALPSPITPGSALNEIDGNGIPAGFYSPSRKAKKGISYAIDPDSDEDEDDDEDAFKPTRKVRPSKRRKTSLESDEDVFVGDGASENDVVEEEDFVVDDDSDEVLPSTKKRKRSSHAQSTRQHKAIPEPIEMDSDEEMPEVSTAQQWSFDPTIVQPSQLSNATRKKAQFKKPDPNVGNGKSKSGKVERRYEWLEPAHITDIDRNRPDHPDYDPRTVYVPKAAWSQFSPFEQQYWEIKQRHWDTIVFFKKGKFYELYENDATIGHQLFDLKLTDRVNMRMVGVPEASLDIWANQFVVKGYKIARVDQVESALGKQMRERDSIQSSKVSKGDDKMKKIINRELACVLTGGTLVDPGMLQDDMSTYCVAIKELEQEGRPAFGIAFVDTATAQFFLTGFHDDVEMTKFETLIAQIRPREILLEKSCSSTKAIRILKNSTGPSTSTVSLKPGKEFWTADTACRELDAGRYFVNDVGDNIEAWPEPLRQAREEHEHVMSAFGALVQYLRTLQIDRALVTLSNISWYDPIRSAGTLVLDGKTLINLEVFANSFDGSSEGTLFSLLNRCITPFGKRTFKQWVCHPLMDASKINARLDAVESLNADTTLRDQFTSQLSKLPDLERIISRIHAGVCKAQEFVRVLDGFEQIDYTMGVLRNMGSGEGIIGQLVLGMPELGELFKFWNNAFDHAKAKESGLLIPERGVEEDFDASQDRIQNLLAKLETLLKKTRKELNSNDIVYADSGKEIYQLEVPTKVKGIPKNWDQMSATQKVKRYYNPELRGLVRKFQEAQETHGQIVKEVSSRFFQKFDEDYATWLKAVRIVAQLDCLICLAKASSALGEPCCRPEFVDDERSIVEFEELRHPCMLPNVTDFIPNDVKLGGETPNINLLTGANAAGKSTVLRMTCVAVIMAQIGCYVPATSARLTPVDRIMSRLGAQDNIFAAQSTFFVELAETKKILSEATPRSLVILDELGRGTSSYDGVAVAQAVLHHVASHIGCVGFFATHYHSLAAEFATHPEVRNCRMRIHVDGANRRVTFLYKLEDGVAEGSFGMHCASMCGIAEKVVEAAEGAARKWEHTAKIKESLEVARRGCWIPLGVQSDVAWMLREELDDVVGARGVDALRRAVEGL